MARRVRRVADSGRVLYPAATLLLPYFEVDLAGGAEGHLGQLAHRALAPRYFSAAEANALAALPDDDARHAFLALWTAKEAACKATGTGIYGWLDRWCFAVAGGDPQLQAAPADAGAHALKIQTYTADTLTVNVDHPRFRITKGHDLWSGEHLYVASVVPGRGPSSLLTTLPSGRT